MSQAPKCKLCGHRHWLVGPHVFEGAPPVRVYESDDAYALMPVTMGVTAAVHSVTKVKTGRPKRYESQAAKQRAYRQRKAGAVT